MRDSWREWQDDAFRGPPPWRRGVRPLYLLASLVLFAALLTVFVLAGSRL